MPRASNLDAKTVQAAQPRESLYTLSDGGGLLLTVAPSGAKRWSCRTVIHGKRRDVGLGAFPAVTLAAARTAAAAIVASARAGRDPVADRRAARVKAEAEARAADAAQARTFDAVAEMLIEAEAPGWKSSRTAGQWRASLRQWASPVLGRLPVAEISRETVLEALGPVWREAPATGKKVRRRVAAVLRFAAARGWRANDHAADLAMLRHSGLPALPGGRGQPALPWQQVPAFMRELEGMHGLAPIALRLLILTALRSGEIRAARWSWVSFGDVPTLTIPGEVMKGRKSADVRAHRVPLSAPAVDALRDAIAAAILQPVPAESLPKLAALRGDALVFPNAYESGPLSDMALSAVVRRMNEKAPEGAPPPWRDPDGRPAVPHGFRSAFSTWADDNHPEERDAAEKALGHEPGGSGTVSAAYRRSDLFGRRAALMRAWGEHCTSTAPAAVVPLARRVQA